ncbi:hypothetical protein ACQRET_11775 [Streptomyces koyangensis]|uniref:hypothetical protein n=1 Tax=Streptomyces koyangensis TaxID=188770 RepID=UPI003D08E467
MKRVAGAGTPVPRQSFWRRWWKAGVVGVVCVVVVVVGLSLPGEEEGEAGPPPRNARTVAAVDLGMWDCLVTQELLELSPADSRTVGEVTVADCGGPHGGEVFSRVSLVETAAENEDGTFRGAAQAEDAARAACAEEFAEGMTDPYSHDFTVRVIHPASSEEWTVRQSAACWVSARGLPEYCLVCETKLTDDQEAFRRALVPYTRAWAGRPPEDASLGARRAWASTMERGIEEAAWLLRGKPELRRLGPEAGADLADALTAQIPYWREAAAAKDPEAHEQAVTEAELAHSAGGEVARARDLIGLAPVITE